MVAFYRSATNDYKLRSLTQHPLISSQLCLSNFQQGMGRISARISHRQKQGASQAGTSGTGSQDKSSFKSIHVFGRIQFLVVIGLRFQFLCQPLSAFKAAPIPFPMAPPSSSQQPCVEYPLGFVSLHIPFRNSLPFRVYVRDFQPVWHSRHTGVLQEFLKRAIPDY